jgi:hypothetical protein
MTDIHAELTRLALRCEVGASPIDKPEKKAIAALVRRAAHELQKCRRTCEALQKRLNTLRHESGEHTVEKPAA